MPYTAALRVLNSAMLVGVFSIAKLPTWYTESNSPRLEWRNWQTHGTQNPAAFTGHEGSTPSSSTINSETYTQLLLAALSRISVLCPKLCPAFLDDAPSSPPHH